MKVHHHSLQIHRLTVFLLHIILSKLICRGNNFFDDEDLNFYDFDDCPECKDTGSQSRVAEWILLNGGGLNPKQEVLFVGCDPTSFTSYGVFAVDDIDEGEILTRIPENLIVPHDGDYCSLVETLSDAIVNDSLFTPYIEHIFSVDNFLPVDLWSLNGAHLLFKIVGLDLPPVEFSLPLRENLHDLLEDECGFSSDLMDVLYFAACMESLFGDEFGLVPFADFYNHRRGSWSNVSPPIIEDDGTVTFIASRPIKEGEQLYIDLNRNENFEAADLFHVTGFIEDFPQKWKIGLGLEFILDYIGTEPKSPNITWVSPQPSFHDIFFLEKELARLQGLSDIKYNGIDDFEQTTPFDDFLCSFEWVRAWAYHENLLKAIKIVLAASNKNLSTSSEQNQIYIHSSDDGYFQKMDHTCMLHNGVSYRNDIVDIIVSPYQTIEVFADKDRNDLCFTLDSDIHTCASFRPSMHEVYVHYPIAYLKSLRRVAFLGGGDSMVLHEILKYSSVEYILGMELDQNVVRKSFEHFHAQPHFDDPKQRVHWIFGDATKTLKAIPMDFYGSFDLVIADIPIEVMNLPVVDDMDLIHAATLLTKKDGVFIINDNLMDPLKDVFKYTMEIHFENHPIYCQQIFVLGSHGNNLSKPNFQLMKESRIANIFYRPLLNLNDHYAPIYAYYENGNLGLPKMHCSPVLKTEEVKGEFLQNGILTIFDAENSFLSTLTIGKVDSYIRALATSLNLTGIISLSYSFNDDMNTIVMIITHHGYFMVRMQRESQYVAIDVNLWAKLDLIDEIKNAVNKLLNTSTSGTVSQFSIVVGSHAVADSSLIADRNLVEEDCTPTFCSDSKELNIDETTKILIEESKIFVDEEFDGISVVLCGDQNGISCSYLDSHDFNKPLVAVFEKPSTNNSRECISSQNSSNGVSILFLCEQSLEATLQKLATNQKKISFLYIDHGVSSHLVYLVEKIFVQKDLKSSFFSSNIVMMMARDGKLLDYSMRSLLHRVRTIGEEFGVSAKALIQNLSGHIVEVGIFVAGRPKISTLLHKFFTTIKMKCGQNSFNHIEFKSKIPKYPVKIDYGKYRWTVQDYDTQPGYDQFLHQKQLGTQFLFKVQLRASSVHDNEQVIERKIIQALGNIFKHDDIKLDSRKLETSTKSSMYTVISSEGQIIAVWDGSESIDINFFTEKVEKSSLVNFDYLSDFFMTNLDAYGIEYYGSQPRGIGRVVTFTTSPFPVSDIDTY